MYFLLYKTVLGYVHTLWDRLSTTDKSKLKRPIPLYTLLFGILLFSFHKFITYDPPPEGRDFY
jgi:hypothetical protein